RIAKTGPIAYEPAGRGELAKLVNRRHLMSDGQLTKLFASAREKWTAADHEPARPQLSHGRKDRIKIAVSCRMHDMEFESVVAGRRLHGSHYRFRSRSGRIHEQGHDSF